MRHDLALPLNPRWTSIVEKYKNTRARIARYIDVLSPGERDVSRCFQTSTNNSSFFFLFFSHLHRKHRERSDTLELKFSIERSKVFEAKAFFNARV